MSTTPTMKVTTIPAIIAPQPLLLIGASIVIDMEIDHHSAAAASKPEPTRSRMVARFIGFDFSSGCRGWEHIPDGQVKSGPDGQVKSGGEWLGLAPAPDGSPRLDPPRRRRCPPAALTIMQGPNCQSLVDLGRHGACTLSESRTECRRYEAERRFSRFDAVKTSFARRLELESFQNVPVARHSRHARSRCRLSTFERLLCRRRQLRCRREGGRLSAQSPENRVRSLRPRSGKA